MTLLLTRAAVAARDTPATAPPQRDYLSFSAISTYRSCPLRYYFRYVAGLPEETVSSSLVFGAAIHRAIEHHFRELLAGNPPVTLADLMAHYRAEWETRATTVIGYGAEQRSALNHLATRMLDAFSKHPLALPPGQILAIEEEARGKLVPGTPDLLGRIDLIWETAEELVISDWKTSRSRWSEDQVLDAAEQLLLYSELVKDFAPGKQIRIEFVVLTKTKDISIERHWFAVMPAQVERTKRIISRVWQAIAAGHFYPAPSPMNCGGCPFREPCRQWQG
jgi:putative RecB family exonuclease